MNHPAPKKTVYTIVKSSQSGNQTYVRIGWARALADGSIEVDLDALPVNGKLSIRDFTPRDEYVQVKKHSEIAIFQAQAREDARALTEGREPRLITTMEDITD